MNCSSAGLVKFALIFPRTSASKSSFVVFGASRIKFLDASTAKVVTTAEKRQATKFNSYNITGFKSFGRIASFEDYCIAMLLLY